MVADPIRREEGALEDPAVEELVVLIRQVQTVWRTLEEGAVETADLVLTRAVRAVQEL